MTGTFLEHQPCPDPSCGSSDAFGVYDDGWGTCFSCGHKQRVDVLPEGLSSLPETEIMEPMGPDFLNFTPTDLPIRGIKRSVCATHDYGVAQLRGEPVQVAVYKDDTGCIIGQKIKTADKKFSWRGDAPQARLWQQHRFKPGGRRLLITEGETDLLAYQSLVPGKDFPSVSLPHGAPSAVKAVKKSLEFVESFEQVILFFDADEAGQTAALAVAAILTPGKAHIAKVPAGCKDICQAIQKGLGQDIIQAYWSAAPVRPDGIVDSATLLQAVLDQKDVASTPYPWAGLNQKTLGMRLGELITLTAGTGIGKSQVCRALAVHLIRQGHKIGYISLEESLARTGLGLLEQVLGKPLHLGREDLTDEEISAAFDAHLAGRVCVFNHYGSIDAENLLSRVKFMRVAEGCDFIFVDHLSILVSGWGDGDERRLIDNVMTALRSTVEQTGVGMILVSHLKKTEGKSHEEGGRPTLRDLRGSAAIGQLSDIVIGMVRNQQSEDRPNVTELLVLKNRFSGLTGPAGAVSFDPETGLFSETDVKGGEDYGF